jgi:hypothetical protein
MGYILLLIAAIILAIYLIAFIVASIPIWGVTLLTMLLSLLFTRRWKICRLNSRAFLSGFLEATIKNDQIEWKEIAARIQAYSDPFGPILLSIITGTVTCWLTIEILKNLQYFHGGEFLDFSFKAPTEIVIYCILTTIIAISVLVWAKPRKVLERAIKKEIERLKKGLSSELYGLQQLAAAEQEIRSLAARWSEQKIKCTTTNWVISISSEYLNEIDGFIEEHKVKLLDNLSELKSLISKNMELIAVEQQNMETAYDLFVKALSSYENTSGEVTRTRSIPLIMEMDAIYRGLYSDKLRIIIESKKWDDYHREVDLVLEKIGKLKDLASKYFLEGRAATDEELFKIMSEKQAYQILGLQPSATNEQIKRVRKKLADIYHPDKGLIKDEHRMKIINLAYDTLKAARRGESGR